MAQHGAVQDGPEELVTPAQSVDSVDPSAIADDAPAGDGDAPTGDGGAGKAGVLGGEGPGVEAVAVDAPGVTEVDGVGVGGLDAVVEESLAGDGLPVPETGVAWRIRPGGPQDAVAIERLVRELAEYERAAAEVEATAEDFRAALSGPSPRAHCHVAEVDGANGPEVVGMALWFVTFSTWRGRHGLWLEDLFVRPDYRRLGLGRELLGTLARICAERGYRRLEWAVLDWNTPAGDFYRSIGAVPQEDWTVWRLDRNALDTLGTPAT